MKREVYIKFKNGEEISSKVEGTNDLGLWFLTDEITINCNTGYVYKRKYNVICGKNITDTIDTINISMKF